MYSVHYCIPRSPGFGLTLVSESTTGVMHAAESSSSHSRSHHHGGASGGGASGVEEAESGPVLPEEIGKQTASQLIEEIVRVSRMYLWFT